MAYYKNQYGKNLTAQGQTDAAGTAASTGKTAAEHTGKTAAGQKAKTGTATARSKARQGQPEKKRRKGDKYVPAQGAEPSQSPRPKKRAEHSTEAARKSRKAPAGQRTPVQNQPEQPKKGLLGLLKKIFTGK